jgi:hypothetical protein
MANISVFLGGTLLKSEKDLKKRFPNGLVFGSRDEALNFLVSKLCK